MRLPNDPITVAVVPQMATPGSVSDDQDVRLGLLRGPIQQLWDIAAIDDDFGLRARHPLDLSDLFDGDPDDRLFPLCIDVGSARAENLHAGGDLDQRERPIDGSGQLGCQRYSVVAMRAQIHGTEDAADRELALLCLCQVGTCQHWALGFVQHLRCY